MGQSIQEWTKQNLWNTAFKFFKGCLPQILLGPLLNILSHIKFGFEASFTTISGLNAC